MSSVVTALGHPSSHLAASTLVLSSWGWGRTGRREARMSADTNGLTTRWGLEATSQHGHCVGSWLYLCYIWRYGRVAAVAGWGSVASVRQEALLGDHDGNPFWPWDQQFLVLICCYAASFFKIRGTQRVDHDQMSTSEWKMHITYRPSRRKNVSMFIFPRFPPRFTPSPFIPYNQCGCVLRHCPPFPNSVIHFQGFGIWDTLI